MAVVGTAHILVRAITTNVRRDIQRGFDGVDDIGKNAGSRMGSSFRGGFLKEADNAYKKFRSLSAMGYITGPAIAGVASALSSVVSGLFAFAAQAAAAAPAGLALAGSFTALIQGAGAFKLAMSGVSNAISLGLKSLSDSGGTTDDFSSQLKAIEDARRNLALTIERAAETEERSTKAVNDAYDAYRQSIIDTVKAVDDLTQAQKDAAEQTQQLGFDVEDAALAQQRAAMALEDAKTKVAATAELPVDDRARQEAVLAYQEADLNYRRAVDRNNDLKQTQEEAIAAGSAGADQIQSASEAVASAKQNEADKYVAYQDAIIAADKARRDSAREVQKAEEAILSAQKALNDAMNSGGGGVDAFAEAMKKLSPEARRFVLYIISLQDEFRTLKAAAGRDLFPQMEIGVQNLVDNLFPTLRVELEKTGGAIGSVVAAISRTLTQSRNLNAIHRIMNTNADAIKNFGTGASNMLAIFIELLDSARPLVEQFSRWVVTLTQGWKETLMVEKNSGNLARTLNYAKQVATDLGQVFKNIIGALKNLGEAASGPGSGGELLLDTFEMATKKFKEFTEQIKNDGSAAKFFQEAAYNLIAISQTVTKIVAGFIKLGAGTGVRAFLDTINQSGGAIDSIFTILTNFSSGPIGKTMGEVVNNLAEMLTIFADSQSIEIFFNIIKKATDMAAKLLSNEVVRQVIMFLGAVHAATTALWLLSVPIIFMSKVWVGSLVKMFGVLKYAIAALINPLAAVKAALAPLAGALGIGTGPLLAVIAAIAALAAIIYLAYQNSEQFRESIKWAIDYIKEGVVAAWGIIKSAFDSGAKSIGRVSDGIFDFATLFKKIGDGLAVYVKLVVTNIIGIVKFLATTIGAVIKVLMSIIGAVINFFKGVWDGISSALGNLGNSADDGVSFFDKIRFAIEKTWEVLSKTVEFIGTIASWLWDNFISPMYKIFGTLIGWLIGKFYQPFIMAAIDLKNKIQDNWTEIVKFAQDFVNAYIDILNGLIDAFNWIADHSGGTVKRIERIAHVNWNDAAKSVDKYTESLEKNNEIAKRVAFTTDEFTKILEYTKTAALNVFDAFYDGRNAFVANIKLSDGLKKSLKDLKDAAASGETGYRELKIQLLDLGQAYIDAARQAIENGEGTDKAAQRIRQGRRAFLEGAEALDYSKEKAKALADKLGLIPNKIVKDFKISGVDQLEDLNEQFSILTKMIGATPSGYAHKVLSEEREVLSAKIESQMTVVFGRGQQEELPLFVKVTNPEDISTDSGTDSGSTSGSGSGSGASWSDRTGGSGYSGGGSGGGGGGGGGGSWGTTDVPGGATGGVARARRGGMIVRIAEAGQAERLEPLDPQGLSKRDRAIVKELSGGAGGGGMTVNVYGTKGMDVQELAAEVSRQVRMTMKKGTA